MQTKNFEVINTKRNLLGFSGGVDSSALFFLLLEKKIPFDIAIVDYNFRKESKEEVAYAKELGKKYNKKIYLKEVVLNNTSNFEKKARDVRYNFFDEIIEDNSYEALITAHQLNDKLEWFLMQFTKGAGLNEILSFELESSRKDYKVFKPLINISRQTLENYLNENNIKYFIDSSNEDENFKRNYFRKHFSNALINEFEEGISNSFEYLEEDLKSLKNSISLIFKDKDLEVYKNTNDDNLNIKIIDESLKKRGILLTKKQRDEILIQKELVVSHKIVISILDTYIYICPYLKDTILTKEFKEVCRINKIPNKVRFYIFEYVEIEKLLEKID
ncbi:tRNA lysidine(34) synthetase TilS [Arcobacter sp. CECT 8989]|uniref:tRNA lysidine(34) synthetase TilS n=1 Tax=Arcobacter sp. CECT 8989 TaxID=2044509 RepID=UPI00100B069F|nr:tRNA lysidine(34) synthetase TilS [Arcobacter sp. CECT 8989]RXK03097.1 tRNA lysidine(34) synthetase TilS [Arcobacter sp. CECT 8989]